MGNTFININTYNDHHKEVTINGVTNPAEIIRNFMAEDAECVQSDDSFDEIAESIIFTKKAIKEGKTKAILQALELSLQNRNDKTRAFVHELQAWQKDEYVDPRFNARLMYDELNKIIPLPFGYEAFKKHYNNTRT